MKKALLAVILLAVVVSVSYIKLVRQKTQTTNAYQQGRQEHTQQLAQYQHKLDSLRYLIGHQEVEFAESVWMREMAYRSTYDSLIKIINLEKKGVDSLKGGFESAPSHKEVREAKADSSKRHLSMHMQILGYYKKRCQALPNDLSPYEKRIALAEIREQTAQKFSISLQELDNIRTDNKSDH